MMNDKFAHAQAARLVALLTASGTDDAQRVDRAFRTLYARPPQAEEIQMAVTYLTQVCAELAVKKLPQDQAWPSLVRALLGANEFFYLD